MKNAILNFLRDEEGLTIVEYAVAGALITVAVVAAFLALGGAVEDTVGDMTSAVQGTP